jgi:hypothetical protein
VSPRSPGDTEHCQPQGRTQCIQGHQGALNLVTPGEDPVSPRSTWVTKHCHPQERAQCLQGHQGTLNIVTHRGGPSVSKVTRGSPRDTKHCHTGSSPGDDRVSPRSPGDTKHCHPQGRTQCLQGHQGALNTVTPRGGPSVSKVTSGH